jgi:hypothetical protein
MMAMPRLSLTRMRARYRWMKRTIALMSLSQHVTMEMRTER